MAQHFTMGASLKDNKKVVLKSTVYSILSLHKCISKRANGQQFITTITPAAKSINPFPILEPLMHEAITDYPICLQALVSSTLSNITALHLFNGGKQQWGQKHSWAERTQMQHRGTNRWCAFWCFSLLFWQLLDLFLKKFLNLTESPPLTWNLK